MKTQILYATAFTMFLVGLILTVMSIAKNRKEIPALERRMLEQQKELVDTVSANFQYLKQNFESAEFIQKNIDTIIIKERTLVKNYTEKVIYLNSLDDKGHDSLYDNVTFPEAQKRMMSGRYDAYKLQPIP
jgi:hypothetical protein